MNLYIIVKIHLTGSFRKSSPKPEADGWGKTRKEEVKDGETQPNSKKTPVFVQSGSRSKVQDRIY